MSENEGEHRSRGKWDVLLATLLSRGETVEQAARIVGMSVRSAYRRMAKIEFKQLMVEFELIMSAAELNRYMDALPESTDTLRRLLRDEDPNVQFEAAAKLIELALAANANSRWTRCVEKRDVHMGEANELPKQTEVSEPSTPTRESQPIPVHEAPPGADDDT
jgi:hypothetical protein